MTAIQVVDVSSNNHPDNEPIDWGAVAKSGQVQAAIVKITEGGQVVNGQVTGYLNPWAAVDLSQCAYFGIPTVCYHFARFGDVATELRWFLLNAGAGKGRVLDFETSTDVAWIDAFCAGLASRNMGYGSVGTYPQSIQYSILRWIASRGAQKVPDDCDLWQFTSSASVPGIPTPCDLSIWTGEPADFLSLFGVLPMAAPGTEVHMTTTLNGQPMLTYESGPIVGTGQKTIIGLVNVKAADASHPIGYWEWFDMLNTAEVLTNGPAPAPA